MKKEIKNAFSDIYVSKELERNILDMTINKQDQVKKRFRLSYVCSIVLVVCLLSITAVYAKEIKYFIQNWSSSVQNWNSSVRLDNGKVIKLSENNNFKEIPNNVLKVDDNSSMPKMTFEEIEDMLKFSILKLKKDNTDEIYYDSGLNADGSIGRIDLWIPSFYEENDDKYVSVLVNMLIKGADRGYIAAFQGDTDAFGEKNIEISYESDNLNTNVIMYSTKSAKERLTAAFVYDDILYHFIGNNISKDEMISIIENLKS